MIHSGGLAGLCFDKKNEFTKNENSREKRSSEPAEQFPQNETHLFWDLRTNLSTLQMTFVTKEVWSKNFWRKIYEMNFDEKNFDHNIFD